MPLFFLEKGISEKNEYFLCVRTWPLSHSKLFDLYKYKQEITLGTFYTQFCTLNWLYASFNLFYFNLSVWYLIRIEETN